MAVVMLQKKDLTVQIIRDLTLEQANAMAEELRYTPRWREYQAVLNEAEVLYIIRKNVNGGRPFCELHTIGEYNVRMAYNWASVSRRRPYSYVVPELAYYEDFPEKSKYLMVEAFP